MKKNKVLVLGWDAADWKILNKLIDEGKMLTFKKFINEASYGKIATQDPAFSPMLWTSIATGKRADKHGILGFIEPNAAGDHLRPVMSTSRKCKAIWNILNQNGYKSNVVSWWPSHPAEPINGVMVSNFYQTCSKDITQPWPTPDGAVHPAELNDALINLRVHAEEITPAMLDPFIPNSAKLALDKDEKKLFTTAKNIASTATVHAISTYLLENTEWDFMAVYLDGIDHFCHIGMPFHPPQLPGIPDDMFEKYKNIVEAGYLFHDMMLERILELVDEDTTIMILSDHGFRSDELRPRSLPKIPAAAALEHAHYGMIAIKGPGVKKNNPIYGCNIIDVTPTLLTLYGLPVGKDMEGKIITSFYENPNEVKISFIDSWEDVEGDSGQHPKEDISNTWAAKDAMQQLIDLGYVEPPSEDIEKEIRNASAEAKFNLARNVLDANRHQDAIPVLEEIYSEYPDRHRYGFKLVMAYLATKRYSDCRDVINRLKESNCTDHTLDYIEALLFLNTNQIKKAEKAFEIVKQNAKLTPGIYFHLGKIHSRRNRWTEAEKEFKHAIKLDNTHAISLQGLGVALLRQGKTEEALDALFDAIEITYHFPQTHYHIGECLYKMGKINEAENAFKTALNQAGKMLKANEWLLKIYSELGNENLAIQQKEIINAMKKGTVYIVSGLPRSGTSMMMQALNAGGLNVLTDNKREADNNNPKGYLEYEPVKALAKDNSWMHLAEGKVVKIIAQLLPYIPGQYKYKIVFMERELDEVLTSQQVMLGKVNQVDKKIFPTGLAQTFKEQVRKVNAWIDSMPNIEMMVVNYSEVIESPEITFTDVAAFLELDLNISEMTKTVDKDLHRNKLVK